MSIPSQYAQRNKSNEPMEDCRDYLRTGRCKYGASCKYRHPPNVQSGGGMKGPINPSEPMFPIRPNEPVCQYYMKHGSCKFGQACKFHHPPSNTLHHAPGPRYNQTLMIQNETNEIGGYDAASLLPQRPEEPNCIYFLKNGRCKYGATCRYHHPLNYHTCRPARNDGRRPQLAAGNPMNDPGMGQPKLHYVSLPPGTYQQGQFVVADGQLAFLSLDGSTQGQVISVGHQGVSQEVPMVFTATTSSKQPSLSRDVGSTTSSTSIASSFESSMIGSGGSLNTFSVPDQQNGRAAHVVHSGSRQVLTQNQDGASLPQVVSTTGSLDGSSTNNNNNTNNSTNNHAYFDARRQTQSPAQSEGNSTAYRGQRSSSFDHSRPARQHMASGGIHESSSVPSFSYIHEEQGGAPGPSQSGSGGGGYQYDSQQQQQRGPQMMRGPPPTTVRGRQKRQSNGVVDDGLSMMTSALLTMLDTPEEVAGEHYQDFDEYPPSELSTPVIANRFPGRGAPQHAQIPSNNMNNNSNYNINAPLYVPQARKAYYDHEQDKPVGMPRYQYEGEDETIVVRRGRSMEQMQRWSPSMQGSDAQQQQPQQVAPRQHASNQGVKIGKNQLAPNAAFEPRNTGSYFP